jgi:hypothetical protein
MNIITYMNNSMNKERLRRILEPQGKSNSILNAMRMYMNILVQDVTISANNSQSIAIHSRHNM